MRIEGDKFSIENEVALKRGERLNDPWEALIKHFLIARKQHDLSLTLHGNAAIAVELDLKNPLIARRQRCDRLALHGFNERRFRALPNLGIHRLKAHKSVNFQIRASVPIVEIHP